MNPTSMDTKYYKAWEEYLAAHPEIDAERAIAMEPKMQGYEEMMFSFIIFLLF